MTTGEELYSGHGWTLKMETAKLPDGREKTSPRAYFFETVGILAFPDPEHILLIREFRPHYGTFEWMLPGGKIDKEPDRDAAAQRELREETGYRSDDLRYYCTAQHAERFVSPTHYYIGKKLVKDPLPQDATEMIEVHSVPLRDAVDRILQSSNTDMSAAFGIFRYLHEYRH